MPVAAEQFVGPHDGWRQFGPPIQAHRCTHPVCHRCRGAAVIATDGTITRWVRVAILTLARLSVAVAGTVVQFLGQPMAIEQSAPPNLWADATTARIAVATS